MTALDFQIRRQIVWKEYATYNFANTPFRAANPPLARAMMIHRGADVGVWMVVRPRSKLALLVPSVGEDVVWGFGLVIFDWFSFFLVVRLW
jgi:hypothetical protein